MNPTLPITAKITCKTTVITTLTSYPDNWCLKYQNKQLILKIKIMAIKE
jgi:hypothetical protein